MSLFKRLSTLSRIKKLQLFCAVMQPDQETHDEQTFGRTCRRHRGNRLQGRSALKAMIDDVNQLVGPHYAYRR